ncbi:MAG: hypothetical protein M3032_12565 [Verrucomicrobiota bacterium]|nr:hypothetical protein [Verrucomicrobiota bacterium]
MKKLIILAPVLALFASVLTSCTTVVHEPVPATTSTTVHETTAVSRPAATTTQTTTTRAGGY